MQGKSAALRYRYEAQQLRQLANGVHSEGIRRELEVLARQYDELAVHVEVLPRDDGQRAVPPTRKRAN
jgi:hypothetical protein